MAADRRRRRRTATLVTAVTAAALTAGLLTGCDPEDVGTSLNCVRDYDTIADRLKAIHEAGSAAASDPSRTDDSVRAIEKNLDGVSDRNKTGDSKVDKAVKDLRQAVTDYDKAVLNGENPDPQSIDKAAGELKDACTPAS